VASVDVMPEAGDRVSIHSVSHCVFVEDDAADVTVTNCSVIYYSD